MFTGIIKCVVYTLLIKNKLYIYDKNFINNNLIELGDSIAINGCCLTVSDLKENNIKFDICDETLDICTFKKKSNVELSLKVGDKIGGHIISGHIFTSGLIYDIIKTDNNHLLYILINNDYKEKIKLKDSISIDGVSLTISKIYYSTLGIIIEINILPFTFHNTIIKYYNINDNVNLEFNK